MIDENKDAVQVGLCRPGVSLLVALATGFFLIPCYAADGADPSVRAAPETLVYQGVLNMTLGLAAVIVLILGIAWLVKRYGRGQSLGQGRIKVRAGMPLGQKDKLIIVDIDGEHLLLGVSPGRIVLLKELPAFSQAADEAVSDSPSRQSFKARLSQEINNRLGLC